MGESNDIVVPRLSRGFLAGMSVMEPLQDQFTNAAAPLRNEECHLSRHIFSSQIHSVEVSSNQANLFSTNLPLANPRPLCAIPAGSLSRGTVLPNISFDTGKFIIDSRKHIATENADLLTGTCQKRLKGSSFTSGVSLTSILVSTHTQAASNLLEVGSSVEHGERTTDFIAPMGVALKKVGLDAAAQPHFNSMLQSAVQSLCGKEKYRRTKISEGIKALQSSVPCSKSSDKGNRDSVLDDVIDYVKYLKLQLRILSQNRLSGESTPYPFVHLEGYGQYLLHQQMSKEPLEEIIGQLIEMSPQAANELLESKGLTILPMNLAYALL